jgi:uncharacterized protein (TIGR00288 family)
MSQPGRGVVMREPERVRTVAVLIDAENAQPQSIESILQRLSEYGRVVAKAYGDWSCAHLSKWPETLERLAIFPHQQFSRTRGKNASDIAMVVDAMDMLYEDDFDAFAIVSSDSDFAGLASRLRRAGKVVFGVGADKTPGSFRSACDHFIALPLSENPPTEDEYEGARGQRAKLAAVERRLIEVLENAARKHAEDDGWTTFCRVGSIIKRELPDTGAKTFGCRTWPQVVAKFADRFEVGRVARGKGTQDRYRVRTH